MNKFENVAWPNRLKIVTMSEESSLGYQFGRYHARKEKLNVTYLI